MATPDDLSPEDRLAALERRVTQLELRLEETPPRSTIPDMAQAWRDAGHVAQPPPPPPPTASTAPAGGPEAQPVAAQASSFSKSLSTEVVLKWAGLILVFLAAGFLVSTAIDRGWIGPELQLVGVVALGLIMIGAGLRILETHRRWAASLVAVGVAILYVSAFAAHEWLTLVWLGVATTGSIGVTLASLWLARRSNSLLVALVGYLGGIVTPSALGAADEYGVGPGSVYLLVLAIVFLLLHIERSWPALYVAVGALSMLLGYAAAFEHELVAFGQVMLVLLALVLLLTPVAHELRHGDAQSAVDRLPTRLVLAVPIWVWGATIELHEIETDWVQFAVAIAAFAVVVGLAIALRPKVSEWHYASFLLAASIVLIGGLFALLDGSALLGVLAVQALAMLLLTRVVNDDWFRFGSVLLAGFVLVVTVGRTLEAIDGDTSVGGDVVHISVFAVTGAIGWMLRDRTEGEFIGLASYAGVILWVLSALVHISQGQVIVSAVWAAIGVVVVLIGLSRRVPHVAWVGMATLALVVAKLLTVDLAEVDTFWRAGLFFVVGAGFLWLSSRIPSLTSNEDDHQSGGPQST